MTLSQQISTLKAVFPPQDPYFCQQGLSSCNLAFQPCWGRLVLLQKSLSLYQTDIVDSTIQDNVKPSGLIRAGCATMKETALCLEAWHRPQGPDNSKVSSDRVVMPAIMTNYPGLESLTP